MEINYEERHKNRIITINKNNKEYMIDISLSIKKYKKYMEIAQSINFEKAFNEIFLENINIKEFDENDILYIISKIVDYYKIEKIYNNINEENIYKRIYDALYKYQTQVLDESKEIIANSLTKALNNLNIDFEKVFKNITNSLKKLQHNLQKKFSNVIKELPSKKQLSQIKKNHKKWGKFGWTIIPNMDLTFFYEVPKTQKEADEKCLAILSDKEIKKIKSYIYKNVKHRKKFNEVQKCYDNQYYLATAMILTSLIERKITELPLKDKNDKKARGKEQITKFKEELNIKDNDIINLYYLENLISYLNMFLEKGNDFKRQPFNVNRNFLMHGWRDRDTTKVDCIKLFLALYNIILLWENRTI